MKFACGLKYDSLFLGYRRLFSSGLRPAIHVQSSLSYAAIKEDNLVVFEIKWLPNAGRE